MNAEIISVGTELLLGHTINTDATFVARELSAIGIDLLYACTVGDNAARLQSALETALKRSDIVITTGGLGPTDDDLTKETVARSAGVALTLHEASLRQLEDYFGTRPFGEDQRKQAFLPTGCIALQNRLGTAPGCFFRTAQGKIVIMLPGPPFELVPMLQTEALPLLKKESRAVIHSCMIRTFGIGEGTAAQKIASLTDFSNPTVATYAKENEMFVRVTAKAQSEAKAVALCDPVVQQVRTVLGDVVYGIDVASLEEVVVGELLRQKRHLAVAESCTGGLLAKRITDISGASAVFDVGVVTYADAVKTSLLGVPESLLQAHGAVSEPVACAMAQGVRLCAPEYPDEKGSLGLGITGVAGPTGGSAKKPVGLIYIALCDGDNTWVRTMTPRGRVLGRDWLRDRAVGNALDMVRRYLCGLSL
ncbi:MAG: competence/damage-inducible protein A [Bilophila sp.]